MSNERPDELSFVEIQEAILQKEEDMKAWCPSSGENVGQMIPIRGTDDWNIKCPTCSAMWAGGSTVLDDHNRPARRG